MGQPAQRKTDVNNAGAKIVNVTDNKVFVNNLLLSTDGSSVENHLLHIDVTTDNGSSTVKSGGISVNRKDDDDSCGHTRVGGSTNVNVGG